MAKSRKTQGRQMLPGVSFRELLEQPVEALQKTGGSVGEALARMTVSEALEGDQRALGFLTQAVMQEMPPEPREEGKDFRIEVRISE